MNLHSKHIKQILAIYLFIAAPFISFSQQTKTYDLTFVVANSGTKKYVKQIDSVFLQNEITKEEWVFDNMVAKDSIFKIEAVELGKFRIIVFAKNLVVPFVDFAICTLCKNKVRMTAFSSAANQVFDRVSIGPHYETGFKQLQADFLSALTSDEAKFLKKSDNKMKVKCFITAEEKLSDIIFEAALSEETKRLILKGFEKTKSWRAAVANGGKTMDDYITLSVAKIVD